MTGNKGNKGNDISSFINNARKKNRKSLENNNSNNGIEIFVSSSKKYIPRRNSVQPNNIEMITIITGCGHKFIVPKPAACISRFIKIMLEGNCSFTEAETGIIHLPDIRGEIFEQILRYLIREWLYNSSCSSTPKTIFSVEIYDESVMELLLACHYLDLPDLLEITCKMLAENILRLSTLDFFPYEVVQSIYSYTDPLILIQLEQTIENNKNSIGGYLSSNDIWKDKYIKKWGDDRIEYLYSFIPNFTLELPPYENITKVLPDTFSYLSLYNNDNSINWKNEYIQRDLQVKLFNKVEFNAENDSLLEYINTISSYITYIQLPSNILQILRKHKYSQEDNTNETKTNNNILSFYNLTLQDLLQLFPNLLHVDIINNHNILTEEINSIISSISLYNIKLKTLSLRNCSMNDEHLIILSQYLHNLSIEVLDLSKNLFSHRGIIYLSKSLSENQYLKAISLNCNQYSFNLDSINSYNLPHWQKRNKSYKKQAEYYKLDNNKIINDMFSNHGIEALFQALHINTCLKVLDIGYNNVLLYEISLKYWKYLQMNTNISCFLFQGCTIQQNNDFNYFSYLPISLEYFDISKSYNSDSNNFIQQLFQSTTNFPYLKAIDLSDIPTYNMNSLSAIAGIINEIKSLESINLSRNQLSSSILSSCLSQHSNLSYINLSSNKLSNDIIIILNAFINTKGKQVTINIKLNNFTTQIRKEINDIKHIPNTRLIIQND